MEPHFISVLPATHFGCQLYNRLGRVLLSHKIIEWCTAQSSSLAVWNDCPHLQVESCLPGISLSCVDDFHYTPRTTKLLGVILVSLRLSVYPACILCLLCSASFLVGSISYLYISLSGFRWWVACKISCKMLTYKFLAIFLNLYLWLCLLLTWNRMWITSMGIHVSECRRSSCCSQHLSICAT